MYCIILWIFVIGTCWSSEPSCSPYDYEEKLLTKMIRQEFLFEKLKEDMLALQSKVTDTLKNVEIDVKTYKAEVAEDREAFSNTMTNMTDKFKEQVRNQESKFQEQKESFPMEIIAFFSHSVSDLTPSRDQTFIFSATTVNEGDGYSNVTGKFTAPEGGFYTFDIQLCTSAGRSNYVRYEFLVNDQTVKGGLFRDFDTVSCYSSNMLARLQSGDVVRVICDNCSGTMYNGSNWPWNTFSGARIHK